MKFLIVIFISFFSYQLLAAAHPCDQTVNDLLSYSRQARQHESDISGFVATESQMLIRWHTALKNWEGQTVTVNPNTFDFIEKESEVLDIVSGQIISNSQKLKENFDLLIQNLKTCL
jgi:hypothetical protein